MAPAGSQAPASEAASYDGDAHGDGGSPRRDEIVGGAYSLPSGSPYQFVPGSPRMRAAPSRIDVTIDW